MNPSPLFRLPPRLVTMFRSLLLKLSAGARPSPPIPSTADRRLSLLSLSTAAASASAAASSPSSIAGALVRAHGFPPESAHAVAGAVPPKLAPYLDSFVALFRGRGFAPSDIASILTRCPDTLVSKASNLLEPKLEFFEENGVAGEALVHVLVNDPYVLGRSLKSQLAPCLDCLVRFFGSREDVAAHLVVKRGTWVLRAFSESMEANIATLRRHGVPDSSIAKMMTLRPRTLSRDKGQFSDIVDEIKGMGFDPSSLLFVHGVISMAGMKRPKWAAKMAVFKKFGWSDEQVKAAFLKQPKVMGLSEEKMEKVLKFFMNGLGWTPDVLVTYPTIFMASFENCILPRLSILLTLVSARLLKRESVPGGLVLSESVFLRRFVMRNSVKAPHILLMYHNKEVLPQFNVVEDLPKRPVEGDQCL